jgi:hypothetical protein
MRIQKIFRIILNILILPITTTSLLPLVIFHNIVKNHYGHAYQTTYDWLKKFKLLALESTSDLIPNQDIGRIP